MPGFQSGSYCARYPPSCNRCQRSRGAGDSKSEWALRSPSEPPSRCRRIPRWWSRRRRSQAFSRRFLCRLLPPRLHRQSGFRPRATVRSSKGYPRNAGPPPPSHEESRRRSLRSSRRRKADSRCGEGGVGDGSTTLPFQVGQRGHQFGARALALPRRRTRRREPRKELNTNTPTNSVDSDNARGPSPLQNSLPLEGTQPPSVITNLLFILR